MIDASLISVFFEAIRNFGIELTGTYTQSQTVKLEYQNSKIIMTEFKDFRIIFVMTENPSDEIKNWWNEQYPDIMTKNRKIEVIKRCGYDLITHFVQPKSDWWNDYYELLEKRIAEYSEQNLSEEEKEILSMTSVEIDMFKKYSDQYGYAFFVMRKKL